MTGGSRLNSQSGGLRRLVKPYGLLSPRFIVKLPRRCLLEEPLFLCHFCRRFGFKHKTGFGKQEYPNLESFNLDITFIHPETCVKTMG